MCTEQPHINLCPIQIVQKVFAKLQEKLILPQGAAPTRNNAAPERNQKLEFKS